MKSLKKLVLENDVCPLPWVHAEIFSSRTKVKPCCKYAEDIETISNNFSDVWQGQQFEQIRKDLKNNIPHLNCSACDVPSGVFSYKKFKKQNYLGEGFLENIDIDNLKGPRVLHLATTDNTCNLACRMCNPNSSSKLASLSTKGNLKTFFKLNSSVESLSMTDYLKDSLNDIMKVTISGGEPMLDKNLKSLIDLLSISKSLRTIAFSTNMTVIDKELLEKLSSLKNINKVLSISLDGPRQIHEYIRHGCIYEDIITNLEYISKNYKNQFKFNINTTVSIYNVGYVKETLESFIELVKKTKIKINYIMSSPVLYPKFLHPGVTPNNLKKEYLKKLESIDTLQYQLYLPDTREFVETSRNLLSENYEEQYSKFLEFNREFDKVTDYNFQKIYPEYQNYI